MQVKRIARNEEKILVRRYGLVLELPTEVFGSVYVCMCVWGGGWGGAKLEANYV